MRKKFASVPVRNKQQKIAQLYGEIIKLNILPRWQLCRLTASRAAQTGRGLLATRVEREGVVCAVRSEYIV